jgi:hypothetical protein
MGKKCIPGVLCIENMTLFLVVVIGIMVMYLYYAWFTKNTIQQKPQPSTIILTNAPYSATTLDNPYNPPLNHSSVLSPMVDIRGSVSHPLVNMQPGLPVNIKTRSANVSYTQVGILTKNDGENTILPLMGRNLWNGRDKWQYYTMSNTAGAMNTKLPVSVNGRSCTSEYGCDSISNGDTIYVEGYNDTFRATIYENSMLQYLPF